MKSIVVEGYQDAMILGILFPKIKEKGISLRVAQGFSNVLAISRTLEDYKVDVLAVLDTDTNIPGNDNRTILSRIQSKGIVGRHLRIAWMDPNIEGLLKQVDPSVSLHDVALRDFILHNRSRIASLEGFMMISSFIEKK